MAIGLQAEAMRLAGSAAMPAVQLGGGQGWKAPDARTSRGLEREEEYRLSIPKVYIEEVVRHSGWLLLARGTGAHRQWCKTWVIPGGG